MDKDTSLDVGFFLFNWAGWSEGSGIRLWVDI
jgi:hypothetical protein